MSGLFENRTDFNESHLTKMEERKALTHIRDPHEINDNLSYRFADEGQRIYNTYCIVCHQAEGKGDGNRYPPLAGSDWVTGDKNKLIKVVLEGLEGPITVNGKTYNDLMPKMNFMSDEDIAKVLTYIRMNLNEDVGGVQEREVARVREGLNGEEGPN